MKKELNILSFKFSLVLGGGERFNILLGKEFVKRGYHFKFFSNYRPFLKRLRSAGIEAKRIYWGKEVGALRNIPGYFILLPLNILRFSLIFLLNKRKGAQNIAVFQSLNEKIFGTGLAKLFGYRVFWVEHISIGPWLTKKIFKKSYIKKSAEAERIIAISKSIKDDLTGELGIPDDKVEIVYSGVDVERFCVMDQRAIENEKKKYGFFKESKIIGYAGRLHKEKGLETLIGAFANLSRRFDHIYLLLVGDGPDRKRLEKVVCDLGLEKKILFLGYKDNVPLFLNMIDVFVLPSRVRESFGISLIEAMAVKKVVVASNLGGIPEIIDDGETGYLFEPGDERGLIDKLSGVLSNEKMRIAVSEKAYQKVKQSFSAEAMVGGFEKLFIGEKNDHRN